jgi:hypothetical protein
MVFHAEVDNWNISTQLSSIAISFLPTHKQETSVSENNFPYNSEQKYNHFKIKCRMNPDYLLKVKF